ncbi:sulfite exporter TauE/SafE family protein [Rhodocista pekingensis]|uniref:Probable membrane transporter protein n=1 Tax=Rhodocista pekingensis TaxID=201185 RepID=A0ABW2KRI6_9PROT
MLDQILLFAAVGFAAQIVDGAIGMAYGVTATTVMLSLGIPPATASASVHAAEVFTTGASGLSHWIAGNVRMRLVLRLALPGMVGGALGAYVLSSVPGDAIRPFVSLYLMAMGGLILWKALRRTEVTDAPPKRLVPLGLTGGFLDAIGGGGWGPLVASTLIGGGTVPRYAIGSTNLAEFFVTAVVSATFVVTIGLHLWPVIAGLILGGVLAAPFAAYVTRRLPDRPLMILVGVVIVLLSLRNLLPVIAPWLPF